MTALSELLQSAIDGGTSVAVALERMEANGALVDRGQLYKALRGQHARNPTERVLQGWSIGFNIPMTDLRRAVKAPAGELGRYTPPDVANRLTTDQRRALDQLIRSIVQPSADRDDEDGGTASITELRTRPTPPVPTNAAANDPGQPSQYEQVTKQQDEAYDIDQDHRS